MHDYKPKQVEVAATRECGAGEIMRCSLADAYEFSVYDGEPGDFTWVADFANSDDATNFAKARALRLGAEFRNSIGVI